MKNNTDAFVRLKEEQQRVLDYTLLTCHAMPNLSKTIKGIEKEVPKYGLATPLYFKTENKDRLKSLLNHFEENLSKYILFSSWSFFEFYFKDCMKELLDFYGGKDIFLKGVADLNSRKIETNKLLFDKTKKIREKPKKGKELKYKDALTDLGSENYFYTNELFSAWGAKNFVNEIASGNFASADIPVILKDLFGFDMTEKVNDYGHLREMDLEQTFHSMREFRNKIGHGEIVIIPFNKVMAYNKFLRQLAVNVDKYLIENYFVLNCI